MDVPKKWKNTLKSGNFRRKVHSYQNINPSDTSNPKETEEAAELGFGSRSTFSVFAVPEASDEDESDGSSSQATSQNISLGDYSPDEVSDPELNLSSDLSFLQADQDEPNENNCQVENLATFLRNWSMEYNISQQALKPLLQKLSNYDRTLPECPRRLLRTPRVNPTIIDIEGGQYWHQGLGKFFHISTYVIHYLSFNYFCRKLSSYVLLGINRAITGGN